MKIAEVLRRALGRLGRKQWLICYPVALAVINTLAFLAVYAANGETLRWSAFFGADFERWHYIRDHFFNGGFSFTPTLAVAVFAGLAVCIFSAMIRAPFYRAIAGPTYPLTPRRWDEAGNLFLYYLFVYLIQWVVPLTIPTEGVITQSVMVIGLVIGILIIFADYVIVFEDLAFIPALRRSFSLLRHRWPAVLLIFVMLQLAYIGLDRLYAVYYQGSRSIFILFPVSHILLQSFVVLVADLLLIFLYEDIRRNSPAS
ncbi:MAG: hypothetical protein A2133_03275 [Actinobacteria bacterium RBG_16_64_13]|nr:MAG: hypothetical protein A2133_03275 [Actinobacteria bacterium RBG_16_64_13]